MELFANTPPVDTSADQSEPPVSYLEALVGEGKKYKDPETLAKSAVDKDSFITQLQQEMAELRSKQAEQKTIDDLLMAVSQKVNSTPPDPNKPGYTNPYAEDQAADKSATKEQTTENIVESVMKALEAKTAVEAQKSNLEAVKQALQAKFGPSYPVEITRLGSERGLSPKILDTLAKESPNDFFKALGISPSTQSSDASNLFSPPASRVNTATFTQQNSGEKNYKYFQKLKTTNPAVYWSAPMQMQMHEAAIKLGEKFYS